jgi:hypothetical protein
MVEMPRFSEPSPHREDFASHDEWSRAYDEWSEKMRLSRPLAFVLPSEPGVVLINLSDETVFLSGRFVGQFRIKPKSAIEVGGKR